MGKRLSETLVNALNDAMKWQEQILDEYGSKLSQRDRMITKKRIEEYRKALLYYDKANAHKYQTTTEPETNESSPEQ